MFTLCRLLPMPAMFCTRPWWPQGSSYFLLHLRGAHTGDVTVKEKTDLGKRPLKALTYASISWKDASLMNLGTSFSLNQQGAHSALSSANYNIGSTGSLLCLLNTVERSLYTEYVGVTGKKKCTLEEIVLMIVVLVSTQGLMMTIEVLLKYLVIITEWIMKMTY
ncbi:hypothetical protein QTO34_007821 [Cnephaeus nilssonii]|uniref:Uncharacterized protein n=1 Tax=Cnephaeus nilssonii TaxID=3371016 RepID=A0AA40HJY0_CNENI|nr:hypothetical protein QTO34_007821 [Eptesicus nilssonii]